jgi:hypothetical protein
MGVKLDLAPREEFESTVLRTLRPKTHEEVA